MESTKEDLKNKFKKGDKPTEVDYADLIDSFVNKLEDNYYKSNTLPSATTAVQGVAKIATTAQIEAGADNTSFVTPQGVKSAIEQLAPVTAVNGAKGSVIVPDYTQDDTGWLPITPALGVTAIDIKPRCRKKVGVVYLEGEISITSTASTNTTLFTLGADFKPSTTVVFYTVGSTGNMVRVQVETSGAVIATNVNSTTGTVDISISTISFLAS